MRVPLESTLLAWASYDPVRNRLEIQFRGGERYLYLGVPRACFQQLFQADSKGHYFNRNIRNHFPYHHVSPPWFYSLLTKPSDIAQPCMRHDK